MISVNTISDYVIYKCKEQGNVSLSVLKHQKILYYIQAWYLAFEGVPAFEGKFQAWIHGPVNREIYNTYKDRKYIYSDLKTDDIQDKSFYDKINNNLRTHIDTIIESYSKYTATELELMTHEEDPWIKAREGYSPNARCEVIIDEDLMKKYYSARLE
jgi:uncharacterized phage-associated protein